MPRGNAQNFKPLTTEEARRRGKNGGKKSAEVRKANASLTEALKSAVTPEVAQQLADVLVKRAKAGNLKAYELVRDQLGEKPVERVEQVNTDVHIDFGNIEGD